MSVFGLIFMLLLFVGSWSHFRSNLDIYLPVNSQGVSMPYKEWDLDSWADFNLLAESKGFETFTVTRVLPANLITNGTFQGSTYSPWTLDGGTLENVVYADNGVSFDISSTNEYLLQLVLSSNTIDRYLYLSGTFTGYGYVRLSYGVLNINCITPYAWQFLSGIDHTTNANLIVSFRPYTGTGNIGLKNVKVYDVSALKLAGLFGGMSDSTIKTILDDYAVNGLSDSNDQFFYTGFDSFAQAEVVLDHYGFNYGTGEVVDLTDPRLSILDLDLAADGLVLDSDYLYTDFFFINYVDQFNLGNPVVSGLDGVLAQISSLASWLSPDGEDFDENGCRDDNNYGPLWGIGIYCWIIGGNTGGE